jgi:hypothetical protein
VETRGCIGALFAMIVVMVLAPLTFVIQWWRRFRRGQEPRFSHQQRPFDGGSSGELQRIDIELDYPQPVDPSLHRRITSVIVRVADHLRRFDDVYYAVHRLAGDPEPHLVPIGPQLQGLGERFLLALGQGVLAGRTVVWMALPSSVALVEVVDPFDCDPDEDLLSLLAIAAARWIVASCWARIGPSWVLRLVLIVPTESAGRVVELLDALN